MENAQLSKDFVQLARTAMSGRPQDVQLLVHRASKKYRVDYPEMADALIELLRESPSRSSPLRKQFDTPLPVDVDSRLQLLRIEIGGGDQTPILSTPNELLLKQLLVERKSSAALLQMGLQPTKSMLFTGPPGVGKTMAAKWVASQLNLPLLVLDLAAVMSSFLGRTGNNIRHVLDYAKNIDCVLLLDELDAIAKRRDDNSEIGELKRLVTVLLQEIDDWPPSGLLLAATNHPDLLDPAVWRRFEVVIQFDTPQRDQIESLIHRHLLGRIENEGVWSKILSYLFTGMSFNEVEKKINLIRKASIISGQPLLDGLKSLMNSGGSLSREARYSLAAALEENNLASQRDIYEITGVSRDTIRKLRVNSGKPPSGVVKKGVQSKTGKKVARTATKTKAK